MMNLTELLKRLTLGMVLASVPLIGGCGGNIGSWQEEVKLLDKEKWGRSPISQKNGDGARFRNFILR